MITCHKIKFIFEEDKSSCQFFIIKITLQKKEKMQAQNYLQKCLKKLVEYKPSTLTPSNNYSLEYKHIENKDNPKCGTEYILKTFRKIQITQKVLERLQILYKMPMHDNVAEVIAKGHAKSQSKVYILYRYFNQSQSLQNLIQNKKQLITKGYLNSIFYQVICGLQFLQRYNINHLRLNPASILVKLPNSNQSPLTRSPIPMVQISDFGVGVEKAYINQYCLHRDYFISPNKNKLHQQKFENLRKYDFWALGCIIYYSYEYTKPFYGDAGFLSNQKIFKQKYVINNAQEWISRKSTNKIAGKQLWQKFLQKCWGIKGESQFESWKQAKQFFEVNYPVIQLQQIPISNLIVRHSRLMFLFSKIYIILRQQLQYRVTQILRTQTNSRVILQLSIKLFKLIQAYHNLEFKKHLQNRCSILPYNQRQILQSFRNYIQDEKGFLCSKNQIDNIEPIFVKSVKQMRDQIVIFKVSVDDKTEYNNRMSILKSFFGQLQIRLEQVITNHDDVHASASKSLHIMYLSQVFEKLAVQLGFQFPSFSLVSE